MFEQILHVGVKPLRDAMAKAGHIHPEAGAPVDALRGIHSRMADLPEVYVNRRLGEESLCDPDVTATLVVFCLFFQPFQPAVAMSTPL